MESPDGAESAEIFTGKIGQALNSKNVCRKAFIIFGLLYLIMQEGNLVTTLHDLFFAAGDTTSGTMAWAVLWITLHPAVQEKFHQEIVKVVGMNRSPQLTDQAK